MFNIASRFRKNVDKKLPMDVYLGEKKVFSGVKKCEYNGFVFFFTLDSDGKVLLTFQKESEKI